MPMRALVLSGLAVGLSVAPLAAQDPVTITDAGPPEHIIHQAEDIMWMDGPPSLPPGARFVVLEGDPSQATFFTIRVTMPDGYTIPPHWHANPERFTVLSGTMILGHGDTLDRASADRLTAGAYTAIPGGMRHFAITEGETTIQITTLGPWQITYVDPADDPRTK